jgi:SNF2 family DNA or RNA helicase
MSIAPLWKHQQDALKACQNVPSFALFFDPGTGKTRTAIEAVKEKSRQSGRTLRVLVLTPQVVTFNWKKEYALYSNIDPRHILVLHGTRKQRLEQLERTPTYFVVVANYETLLMDPVFDFLKTWSPEVLIADESHRIKNSRAQRTRRAVALADLAKHKFILSGTPILQNSMDLFSQYLFLDGGKTLGKNNFTFKNQYFRDANKELRIKSPMVTWPKWVPIKAKEKELTDKIMSMAMAVKKDECLDLPPYIQQTIEVGMSAAQARAYKEMKNDYITFINSTAYTAQLAITKALRLQQIASGFLMDAEGKVHAFEDSPKEKALLELLEDLTPSSKVIVWSCWVANQLSIGKLLDKHSYNWRGVFGSSGAAERDRSLQDFREDPEVRVLVGSTASLGIGVNLVEANQAIFYSRNFSLEQDIQAAARTYRAGAEVHKSVHRIDLVTRGSIDESIAEALINKQQISDSIILGLKI